MSDDLAARRAAIDALDRDIVRLVSERAGHARAIGALKGDGPIYRPEREAQVLDRVRAANPGPLANEALARIYVEIMSACRALEQPLAVSYLGPAGTFSEMAMLKQFGGSVEARPCASIDEVFRQAETGALDVHAYDHDAVLAGQGTVGREFEQDAPDLTHLLVATGGGGLIEIQGTAEGASFSRAEMDAMVDLAQRGIHTLIGLQHAAIDDK